VEGTKRKANWADRKCEDIVDMGVLEEDWAALHGDPTSPVVINLPVLNSLSFNIVL
jgi:hypothetical protein